MPFPVVLHLSLNGGMFIFVENIIENSVIIKIDKNKTITESVDFIQKYWDGNLMAIDYENIKPISVDNTQIINEYFNLNIKYVFYCALLFICGFIFSTKEGLSIYSICFLLSIVIGLFISYLFKIRDFDSKNEFVNSVCHSKNNDNRDCSSILDTKDSRFIGLFKWSDFGAIYFIGLFVVLLIFDVNISNSYIAIISIMASIYIPYSIFYQKFIAKKWCTLCLFTQGVLFVNLLIAILYIIKTCSLVPYINYSIIFSLVIVALLVISLYSVINLLLYKAKQHSVILREYQDLKIDENTVKSQFQMQNTIIIDDVFRILISPNTSGKSCDCVTIVFNTVCIPCINKLKDVLYVFRSKRNTVLELVFLLNPEDVKSNKIASVLIDKYLHADKNNFLEFLTYYTNNFPESSLKCETLYNVLDNKIKIQVMNIITQQNAWCNNNKIYSTPQMFLNYSQVPYIYEIKDIDLIVK